jgi:pilus assembly protein CpaB
MAIVLAGSVTYVVYRRLRASAAERRVVPIVAASRDLPAGITLAAEDVTMFNWPADIPLAGSFPKTEAVIGRPLIYSLGAKEPVLERDLAVAGSGIGLAAKIPPGMRATAVRSNEIVGVAGFLFPGSHLDVLATYNPPGGSGSITQTVLQDVEVLAAGQTIEPDPQGKPQTVSVVTLLLSPEDSQRLLLTSTQGTIQFVLRSGADQKKVAIDPTRLDQLVAPEKPAPPPVTRRPRMLKAAPPPEPPAVSSVEVIQGSQRSVQKF